MLPQIFFRFEMQFTTPTAKNRLLIRRTLLDH